MKYVLAIMWAVSLVLMVFGTTDGAAYGALLFCATVFLQIMYWIYEIGEGIGEVILVRQQLKYDQQHIAFLQRERELALLEQIANK